MRSLPRWVWYVLAVIAMSALLAYWWSERQRARFEANPLQLLKQRPAEINRQGVEEWSVKMDGKEFGGAHHVLHVGQKMHFSGYAKPRWEILPPGAQPSIKIALRRRNEGIDSAPWSAEEWKDRGREWGCGLLGIEREINVDHEVSGRFFEPGEYAARIYFLVQDQDAGENTVDLLDTASVTILPKTNNEMQQPDPKE